MRGRACTSPAADHNGAAVAEDIEAPAGEHAAPAVGWGNPESAFVQSRFFEVLERGIARLPGKAARAFRMREVQGMSTDEICRALGITAAHCAVLLYRARTSLRDHLQAEWFSHTERPIPAGASAALRSREMLGGVNARFVPTKVESPIGAAA